MKYPIKPVFGNNIQTHDGQLISLSKIIETLLSNSVDSKVQKELFRDIGIIIDGNLINVCVKESGKAYFNPDEDRTNLEDNETSKQFNLQFECKDLDNYLPIDIKIDLSKVNEQEFVNFLGDIIIKNVNENKIIYIPLTGKGTAALEGRLNDAHAGLCTGGACASFQQKTALLSAIIASFPITRDTIESFRANIIDISSKYHGRDDILNYTIDRAFGLTDNSYFEYMRELHTTDLPIMLKHFLEFSVPHPKYYELLKQKLTESEYTNALSDTTTTTTTTIKVSSQVINIINKFIIYNDLYYIKVYEGNPLCSIPLCDIAQIINNDSTEKIKDLLEKLGIIIYDEKIKVQFYFKGINLTTNRESETSFEMDLKRYNKNLSKIPITINLDDKPFDNINFFGKIEIKNSFFRKLILPLLGRGTIDINETVKGNQASRLCIDKEFASFQQRIALYYSIFVHYLSVDKESMDKFHEKMLEINKCYFKRHNIIEYLYLINNKMESNNYFDYCHHVQMKNKSITPAIKTILTYNQFPCRYFQDLVNVLSEDEIIDEEHRFDNYKVGFSFNRLARRFSNIMNNL